MHVRSLREDSLALRPFGSSGPRSERGDSPEISTQTSFMPMFVARPAPLELDSWCLPPGDARGALHRDCEDTSGRAAAARFFLLDALLGSFVTQTPGSPPQPSSPLRRPSLSP